jgi:hypothetical protein
MMTGRAEHKPLLGARKCTGWAAHQSPGLQLKHPVSLQQYIKKVIKENPIDLDMLGKIS